MPKIRHALSEDLFKMVFQPVVDVSNGKVSHYETLLRMIGDDGELLSPIKFIPVAERMGLIHHIDLWVVSHAKTQTTTSSLLGARIKRET